MRRRAVLGAVGICSAWPTFARAREAASPAKIGVLCPFSPTDAAAWHKAFEAGLRELGWIEGTNIGFEYRYAQGATERLPGLTAELLGLKVGVLLTETTEASQSAQKATATVPIVFVAVGDPLGAGLVASLARPGGNVTGLSQSIVESAGKRLEMLKLVIPDLTEAAVLWNPANTGSVLAWRELQGSAERLGVNLKSFEAPNDGALDKLLEAESSSRARALYVAPDPLFVDNQKKIATFAKEHRMASIFHLPDFVRVGGLLAYGPDRIDLFRRAAGYVAKILRGAKPADLPVEQPTKFALSVNLDTARAVGVAIPTLLLTQADEVIE